MCLFDAFIFLFHLVSVLKDTDMNTRILLCGCVSRLYMYTFFLTVPILACGGDDSRVHLYVQANGEVG